MLSDQLQKHNIEGQQAHLQSKFLEAHAAFTRGIDLFESSPIPPQNHVLALDKAAALYANRAQAAIELAQLSSSIDLKQAMKDSDRVVELKKDWFRGYQRRAQVYAVLFTLKGYQQVTILEAIHNNINKAWQLIETIQGDSVAASRMEIETLRSKYLALRLPSDPKIQEFLTWTQSCNVETVGLEIRTGDKDYRAVHATMDLRKGRRVALIPKDALMSLEIAMDECKAAAILKKDAQVQSQQTYLACYLLEQRTLGEKSRWHAYMQLFPQEFPSMPCTFDEKAMKELQTSSLIALCTQRKKMIEDDYKLLEKHVSDFTKLYSLQDFYWARMVVLTRVFSITVDSTCLPKRITEVLAPIADMLNHQQKASTEWKYDEKLQSFVVVTTSDITAGEQVFDSYGRKCNTILANGYGFALEHNPDNTCVLAIHGQAYAISANHRHEGTVLAFSRLRHLFHDFQLELDKNPIVIPKGTPEERKLAFNQAQSERFKKFIAPDHTDQVQSQAVDEKTEHYMIAAIAEIGKLRLKEFATSLQEDEKLWADHKTGVARLSPAMEVCVLVRRGEKQVIQHYINLLEQVQVLIHMRQQSKTDPAVKTGLKKYWLHHRKLARENPMSDYLVSVWEKL